MNCGCWHWFLGGIAATIAVSLIALYLMARRAPAESELDEFEVL